MYQKSPPFEFLIFCNKIYVDEAQRVPPFTFFGTMPLFLKEKIFKNEDIAPTLDVPVLLIRILFVLLISSFICALVTGTGSIQTQLYVD